MKKILSWCVGAFACLIGGGLALVSCPAQAQPRLEFAGKTVTILSSFGPGGGYTTYADLLARHLGAYLPGRPAIVVKV